MGKVAPQIKSEWIIRIEYCRDLPLGRDHQRKLRSYDTLDDEHVVSASISVRVFQWGRLTG